MDIVETCRYVVSQVWKIKERNAHQGAAYCFTPSLASLIAPRGYANVHAENESVGATCLVVRNADQSMWEA